MASTRAVPRLAIVGAVVLLSAAAAPRYASDASIADAEMRGDTSAVRVLLKQGADVNAAQGDGMTALHWAAMHGDVDQTRMLIYAGARLEASTRNGNYTPLHLAAQTGKTSVIKALVQAGADVNAVTTAGGATPLHYAAANGNADAIVALLDKGREGRRARIRVERDAADVGRRVQSRQRTAGTRVARCGSQGGFKARGHAGARKG
jgi:ankyrin repeat protein